MYFRQTFASRWIYLILHVLWSWSNQSCLTFLMLLNRIITCYQWQRLLSLCPGWYSMWLLRHRSMRGQKQIITDIFLILQLKTNCSHSSIQSVCHVSCLIFEQKLIPIYRVTGGKVYCDWLEPWNQEAVLSVFIKCTVTGLHPQPQSDQSV